MLVVDRTVFAQLQADHTGIDFMELSANLIRAQRLQTGSNPSILESEATSKGLSPTSIDFLPPAYEDIFGAKNSDLPPSYSEISMMSRNISAENSERCSVVSVCERVVQGSVAPTAVDAGCNKSKNADDEARSNNCTLRTSSSAPFAFGEEGREFARQLREFSSLENNIERSGPGNGCETDSRKRNVGNDGEAAEACGNGGTNRECLHSEPGMSDPPNAIDGGSNPESRNSVQCLSSLKGRRSSNCTEGKKAKEYIDRESSV